MLLNRNTLVKLLTSKTLSLTNNEVYVSLMGESWNKVDATGALATGNLVNKKLDANTLVFSADKLTLPGVNGQFRYLVVHIGSEVLGYKDVGSVQADNQDVTINAESLITFATAS